MSHKPNTPITSTRRYLPRLTIDTYLLESFTPDSTSTSTATAQDNCPVDLWESDALELSRIDSWVEQRSTQLDIREATWTPEPRGESGPSGCRGRVGMARLDRWMKEVEKAKVKGNRNREGTEWERRKRQYRSRFAEVFGRQSNAAVPLAMEGRQRLKVPQESCSPEKVIAKKGSKFFRAGRRMANVFRQVERPVESVIARKRFIIH